MEWKRIPPSVQPKRNARRRLSRRRCLPGPAWLSARRPNLDARRLFRRMQGDAAALRRNVPFPGLLPLILPLCLLLILLPACSRTKTAGAGAESSDRVGQILYEHVMAQNDTLTAENRDLKVRISRLEVRERELRGLSLAFRKASVTRVRVRKDEALLWMPSKYEMPAGVVAADSLLRVVAEGADESGDVWLLASRDVPAAGDDEPLAGWIRQDRTEPAADAEASASSASAGDNGGDTRP